MDRITTIGVYGFTPDTFAAALRKAGVDTLVDIRRRRGVRGREYAFANSQRLQELLAGLGIRYTHDLSLAPSASLIKAEGEADKAEHVARRQRDHLSEGFIRAYQDEALDSFDPAAFASRLPEDARVIALLCVEREPEACHRSLAAARLGKALRLPVEHLRL